MSPIKVVEIINLAVAILFALCYTYQFVYILISLFVPMKSHKKTSLHRYAVMISARNEENVLPHLLDSLRAQDYPADYFTVFVIADNCTDRTAEVARAGGAVVYERNNANLVGKGYALDFLLSNIKADYGEDAFDAYMIFDADNLLNPDYITEMNKTFSDGHQIITSYRNSKNYGDNWISAGYALWFLREAKFLNHARMLIGSSCAVSGTGFLFSREILKKSGGWKFFLLTEDIEFSVWNIVNGRKIAYCPSAVLYDEQPTSFKQSWRQRMRWAKGNIQVYLKYAANLATGMFRHPGAFSCFDMTMVLLPAVVLSIFGLVLYIVSITINFLCGVAILELLKSFGLMLLGAYTGLFAIALTTTISEWKKIHTTTFRKILYSFTFPLFMATWVPIGLLALVCRVEWKPIEHKRAIALHSIQNRLSQ